ncbi:MAG: hypothetical protein IKB86_02330 [Clostridia bacterium]|nr:hypothetical protein [Clostridia bacterium]
MSDFKVGFSAVNVTPPMNIGIGGYYVPRFAKGVLDELDVRALALSLNGNVIFLISVPVCGVDRGLVLEYGRLIEKATGVPKENVFVSATHTHTGGLLVKTDMFKADEKLIEEYSAIVKERITEGAVEAFKDLKPAKMGYAVGKAPDRIAYIRRYKMKDGSTMTCPPINDPNIDYPIGELDQRINVVRFDREGAESVVLVNYGLHADTVNGEMLSGDWPAWMYKTIENALDGTKSIFFNGAEGDVGSTNVHPTKSDMNDTEISFDNEMKSPGMSRFVGRAVAGTVLQVFDKVNYEDVDNVKILRKMIYAPANCPEPEDMPTAHKYKELHDEGRDDLIPYTAMELTTVVAEALRMCRMEFGPKEFALELVAVQIGPVVLLGIPGEPFTDIGMGIKETSGWGMIMPCSLANGDEGYFPVKSAYDEGGYEARTSPYKAGVAELIVKEGKDILDSLKKA